MEFEAVPWYILHVHLQLVQISQNPGLRTQVPSLLKLLEVLRFKMAEEESKLTTVDARLNRAS